MPDEQTETKTEPQPQPAKNAKAGTRVKYVLSCGDDPDAFRAACAKAKEIEVAAQAKGVPYTDKEADTIAALTVDAELVGDVVDGRATVKVGARVFESREESGSIPGTWARV